MDENPIRVLLIEDNSGDVRLIKEMLRGLGGSKFELSAANSLSKGLEFLSQGNSVDVLLLDLSLPDCRGLETFTRVYNENPDLPIVVLTGLNDEELGVRTVRDGAQDYLLKGQVDGHLLTRAVRYAIERKHAQREKEKLIRELQSALSKIKTLSGLLPICSACKNIRDDMGYWQQVEVYIKKHSEVDFSHSLCPECAIKLYPDYFNESDFKNLTHKDEHKSRLTQMWDEE
ncbi:MAG: response regulator [Candidatus Eremiobacteraeota bacterium]|nr:response regulator [Candidatus Eremiobacteraeota bacterium]